MRFSKLLLATIGAAVLLGAAVDGASARSFSTSSQTWRALFTGLTFNGVFGTIVCEVQLEGSIHARTIAKVVGSLIGYITEARVLRCSLNSGTVLRETLPWHVRYASFTGTLPNITSIRANVIGFSFRIREAIPICLGTSTAARPAIITINRQAGGALSTAEIGGTIPTDCGVDGTFGSNSAPITVLNSATRITVTLI